MKRPVNRNGADRRGIETCSLINKTCTCLIRFSSHNCFCPLALRKSFDILALYKSDYYYYYYYYYYRLKTELREDRQTDRQTNKRQALHYITSLAPLANVIRWSLYCSHVDLFVYWFLDRPIYWLTSWLIDQSIYWLTDLLISFSSAK